MLGGCTQIDTTPCCRQVSLSAATVKGCRGGEADIALECSNEMPCSQHHHPSEMHRAGLLAPLASFVKINLNLLNGVVTGYPFPFYFLVCPSTYPTVCWPLTFWSLADTLP